MKSFLIHIYPRGVSDTDANNEIVGVVEGMESEKQNAFTSPIELWEILQGKYQVGHLVKKTMISGNNKRGN